MQKNRLSILANAARTDLRTEPYPHLIIKNALDPYIFSELQRTLPPEDIVLDGREAKDTWFDYPACKVVQDQRISPVWREFFSYHTSGEFFKELMDLVGDEILRLYPDIEQRIDRPLTKAKVAMRPGGRQDRLAEGADVSMECQFYVNYTTQERAVRGSHIDRPSELFAALLYFRQPEDNSHGGHLVIKQAKQNVSLFPKNNQIRVDALPMEIDEDKLHTSDTVMYEANTLVLFINSPKSIHAVSARSATPIPRRHINFCCDLNIDLFEVKAPARLAIKSRLMSTPVLWRLANWI